MNPMIILDVDGVLNPFNVSTKRLPIAGYKWIPTCPSDQHWWQTTADLWVRLNHRHGDWLQDLAAEIDGELVWGTGWQWAANDWIGPHLDLPEMPWIPIGARDKKKFTFGQWKALQVAAYTNGRPFVWFDDEPDAARSLAKLTMGPHLVVQTYADEGLTHEHMERARRWAHRLAETTV